MCAVSYFPEMESLVGDFGFAGLQFGGLTVPQQEVALVTEAAWFDAIGVDS